MRIVLKNSNMLRQEIAKLGLTQQQFSDKVSVSPKYLSAILCEHKNPSPKLAKAIAIQLELSPSDLFYYTS